MPMRTRPASRFRSSTTSSMSKARPTRSARPRGKTPRKASRRSSRCWASPGPGNARRRYASKLKGRSRRSERRRAGSPSLPTGSYCGTADVMYSILDQISDPAALRRLDRSEVAELARELRAFLVAAVAKTGGHLSSNLGTVELTIALHYVFDTPHDRIVWDVGHQTYGHKVLTGRREKMNRMRMWQGLSGFPRREESEYDTFGTAHSSTSISAALGMAVASRLAGASERRGGGGVGAGGVGPRHGVRGAQQRPRDRREPARHLERQRDVDLPAGGG